MNEDSRILRILVLLQEDGVGVGVPHGVMGTFVRDGQHLVSHVTAGPQGPLAALSSRHEVPTPSPFWLPRLLTPPLFDKR